MDRATFIRSLPKAELHVHIEGTLEPEMMFDLAKRNGVDLPFASVDAIRRAYEFTNLQSFLDIYYRGAAVLVTERDFHDLMYAYLVRAHEDGVRRAEVFFDPQTHTARGVPFATFMHGFATAIDEARSAFGISTGLIMCFLRHLTPHDAVETWKQSAPYREALLGVGLDSSEVGIPPDTFAEVFRLAHEAGVHTVAHAGEEGPAAYVASAIEVLGAERIDHGVRAEEDPGVVDLLVERRIPLTMCPMSNLKLRVVDRLEDHNLLRLLDRGVRVTVNSDDPAYFGGYVADNYMAVADALDLDDATLVQLARNSLEASFLPDAERRALIDELARVGR